MKPKYREGQIVISSDGRWWLIKRMKLDYNNETPCHKCDLRRLQICNFSGRQLKKLFGNSNCTNLIGRHDYARPDTLLAFINIDKEGGGV